LAAYFKDEQSICDEAKANLRLPRHSLPSSVASDAVTRPKG